MNFVDDSIEDKALTIGAAMPNTEVKIIDPDTGDTVPIGEVGELCVRGYHVMVGYHDMPEDRPLRRSTKTAGCARATSPRWTNVATAPSRAASRT